MQKTATLKYSHYSFIWRAHISTDNAFKDFKIPKNCEKDLRKTLMKIVPTKISELNDNLKMLNNQRWNYILLKPKKKVNNLHSIHYNSEVKKKGLAFIYAFEYAIIFVTNKRTAILNNFKRYENKNFEELKFLQMETKLWNSMMIKTVQEIMKKD